MNRNGVGAISETALLNVSSRCGGDRIEPYTTGVRQGSCGRKPREAGDSIKPGSGSPRTRFLIKGAREMGDSGLDTAVAHYHELD